MSPTVPTTTDGRDSWLGPSSLPSSTGDAVSHLVRVDPSTGPRRDDAAKSNEMAMHNDEETKKGNGRLLTHQVASCWPTGNGHCRDHVQPMTVETAEFWVHQLRSVLHETRSNLDLIVAYHHHQMKETNRSSSDLNLIPSRTRVLSKSVAVQTGHDVDDEKTKLCLNLSTLDPHRKPVATPDGPSRSPPNSTTSAVLTAKAPASSSPCLHRCSIDRKWSRPTTMLPHGRDRPRRPRRANVDATAALLDEAWHLAGWHSRHRMSILSGHYRSLYRRHRRLRKRHGHLRRSMRRTCRLSRSLRHQLQILSQSIVSQVDEVACDWVDRLKGLLDSATVDSADGSYSPLDLTARSSSTGNGCEPINSPSTSNSFSLYRWYSSLSMKLSWIQTSHRNVIDNIVSFQRLSRHV